jgi:hypothetical protein
LRPLVATKPLADRGKAIDALTMIFKPIHLVKEEGIQPLSGPAFYDCNQFRINRHQSRSRIVAI